MQDYPQFDFSTVIAARLVPVITEATDPDYIAAELGSTWGMGMSC